MATRLLGVSGSTRRRIASTPTTPALIAITATTMRPARRSARLEPSKNAAARGTAVRASPTLWTRSARSATLPLATNTTACVAAVAPRTPNESTTARIPSRDRLMLSSINACEWPYPCRCPPRTRIGVEAVSTKGRWRWRPPDACLCTRAPCRWTSGSAHDEPMSRRSLEPALRLAELGGFDRKHVQDASEAEDGSADRQRRRLEPRQPVHPAREPWQARYGRARREHPQRTQRERHRRRQDEAHALLGAPRELEPLDAAEVLAQLPHRPGGHVGRQTEKLGDAHHLVDVLIGVVVG